MGKHFYFLSCFCISALLFCGCGNSNIFSWAHDVGSGSFESLKSDGDAAMKDNKYSDAAKYYEAALKKNPNDSETALGFMTANFFEVLSVQYGDIVNTFITQGSSSAALMSFLNGPTASRMVEALTSSMGAPGARNGYLTRIANDSSATTNVLLNAALANVILGVAEVFANSTPLINQYIRFNGDFSVTVTGIPTHEEAQALLTVIGNLLLRASDSVIYINRAPVVQGVDPEEQARIMKQVSEHLVFFQTQLEAAKNYLQSL